MTTIACNELDDGILEVRLNRPERLNAINPALIGELIEVFRGLQRDRQIRVVILTGAGKGFCAGADLQEFVAPGGIPGTAGMSQLGFVYKFQEYLAELMLAIHECDKPVIAAVNGAAVGGGLAIALASDIRIASDRARFGAVFIKTGLSSCDVGTSYFLPRLVGAGVAADLMLSGRIIDAAEAREIRLVSRVVTSADLASTAMDAARSIRENSEYGVWMTKKGLWANVDAPSLRHAMELENRTQVLGSFTGCMEESMQAFGEGRKPSWKPL
ncbi:MAG: enoyl-CoA hydratase/isomerase family protein [Gammaproteobacteria bacterium]|nr:enoyl-CoA hydratase/isomerase family protein [Gammaproteobacteria bacterium]MBK6582665.1 enoyl-CoA hydratase/isomerase family protein [Gammaproteobacteria bacterium]MBK7518797.1 enoyl-CoA hydratase/isomerase family protein [Gammaproteobacteria bacterium]MBK7730457.1 enoyl-CoA hydratase/isomerase family protein [Gammaproteobacteria bacterium]MBK8307228.1 enoyl-CoA hydratase/isomerase family protein [Gammaproteobacteria bacterium]